MYFLSTRSRRVRREALRLLLDTHALLWAVSDPQRLPASVAERIADASTLVYASAASSWEIAIMAALGKVTTDAHRLAQSIRDTGFRE